MRGLADRIWSMSAFERKLTKTAGTVVLNGATGAFKLFLGIYYLSDWLTVNALYYLVLSITKWQILKKYAKVERIEDAETRCNQENEIFWKTGRFECLIGVSYFTVSLHTLLAGDTVSYPEYIRYVMVLVALGKIAFGVYGLCQTRRYHDPVIAAIRIVDFTDAVVSIVVCRSVLQVMKEAEFAVESSGILGILCSVLFVVIGAAMIRRGRKERAADR